MRREFRAAAMMALLMSAGALAAQREPAQVLEGALGIYKAQGPEAFVKKLLEGGPMEGNKDALAQSSMLRSVEAYFGTYSSFEVVQTVEVTATTRFVYVVLNYTDGPMFGALTFYRSEKGWHVISFNFHTEAPRVWPGQLLSKC